VRKLVPRDADAARLPDWPADLLSNGAIVAILAVSAYFSLSTETERMGSARIYRVDLNAPEQLPEGAEFVSSIGRIQGNYSYVIEKTQSGRIQSATVYAPFTATQWTPDPPVTYIVALRYGYGYEDAPHG
jgi:hypothetical protein